MSFRILQGDVFSQLPTIAPGSVDIAVTSPPYWMLRSYLPKDHPLKSLEIGQEKTPGEYIDKMVRVFDLVRDALADHGTCWINIGDTYSGGGGGNYGNGKNAKHSDGDTYLTNILNRNPPVESGNLCLIPQRLMIALQDRGWIVRSVVIWHKPSAMPTSVFGWKWVRCRVKVRNDRKTHHPRVMGLNDGRRNIPNDRPSNRDETQWTDCPGCKKCTPNGGYVLRKGSWRPTSSYEPVIMLAKSKNYFCDGEAVKTPAAAATIERNKYTRILDDPDEQFAVAHDHEFEGTGANLRDVWTIAAEPLKAKHYAAYPTELVYRCLAAGTSARGYCARCSAPWARIVEEDRRQNQEKWSGAGRVNGCMVGGGHDGRTGSWEIEIKTLGWRPTCACGADTRPALVLDPFAGSGRTGRAAQQLGLDFVGVELNPEYAEMSSELIGEVMPLFS